MVEKMARKSLFNRSHKEQYSDIEWALINTPDSGFVRYLDPSGRAFQLDPSKFSSFRTNNIYYVDNPPPEGVCIQARVEETLDRIDHGDVRATGYAKKIYDHLCSGYSVIDPSSFIRSRKEKSLRYLEYLAGFFRGDEDTLEQIALSSALFTSSSPSIVRNDGGINASFLGNKSDWGTFNRVMDIIPLELYGGRPCCCTYEITEVGSFNQVQYRMEQCRAHLKYQRASPEIYIGYEDAEGIRPFRRDYLDDQQHLQTAYMIDSLQIPSTIPECLVKSVTETLYEVRNDLLDAGMRESVPLSARSLNRVVLAMSRFHGRSESSAEDIKRGTEIWGDTRYRSQIYLQRGAVKDSIPGIGDTERRLYRELVDHFGSDSQTTISTAKDLISVKGERFDYALRNLEDGGFVAVINGTLRILTVDRTRR